MILLSDTIRSTEKLGEKPVSNDPFKTSSSLGWYFGLSYAFSK